MKIPSISKQIEHNMAVREKAEAKKETLAYGKAAKAWKKVGAVNATGDSLAAMYAGMIPLACCLDKKVAPKFYTHFRNLHDDESMRQEFKRLQSNPLSCFDIF